MVCQSLDQLRYNDDDLTMLMVPQETVPKLKTMFQTDSGLALEPFVEPSITMSRFLQ